MILENLNLNYNSVQKEVNSSWSYLKKFLSALIYAEYQGILDIKYVYCKSVFEKKIGTVINIQSKLCARLLDTEWLYTYLALLFGKEEVVFGKHSSESRSHSYDIPLNWYDFFVTLI